MFHRSERIALAALDRSAGRADWLRLVDGLHAEPGFWWLDSALEDGRLGRFSFAGADPYLWLTARAGEVEIDVRREVRAGLGRGFHRFETDPVDCARSLLPRADSLAYSTRTSADSGNPGWHEVAGLSAGLELPFMGGAVGYFGYELAGVMEGRLRFENANDLEMPDLVLAFVDRLLVYDHEAERLWVVGLGFGDAGSTSGEGPREAAVARSREVVDDLARRVEWTLSQGSFVAADPAGSMGAPMASLPISSTVDASGYTKAVDTVLEEIGCGNVYQANFSQRLTIDAAIDPWALYRSLRMHNPAPFGAYLAWPDAVILSSSPERFLRVDDSRRVESRPIKGTRARGGDAISDDRLAHELSTSTKDRAENLMIVDLVRNDLGRVCTPGSIGVPELMRIETYAAVFQMVSTVTGELATGRDVFDLVRATFPPGSMTGAPKLASIELLEQLESVRRGVYAGALGYFDVRGGLDLSVVIRTIVLKNERAHLHVGGGIVADSSPEKEYLESLDKARAPLAAIGAVLGPAVGDGGAI
ncbi:MAG: aminodeoxychorismate synthase component I [bacterium]|nr:aminodeoxychorismate synthase, component I [Deltaproteobacteria bacterium]MCP4903743.1 aminodeoxychorismate synthase component I [bacterium]